MSGLETEFPFLLPKGWVDSKGELHRQGRMRLATARDELEALAESQVTRPDDPRLALHILSRVIVSLGPRNKVGVPDLQNFFAADLVHLQDMYSAINYGTDEDIDALSEGTRPAALRLAADEAPVVVSAPVPAPPRPVAAPVVAPTPVEPAVVESREADDGELEVPDDAALLEQEESVEPRAVSSGRRARIEELGRSSKPAAGRR